jgi:hypothetical protein
VIEAGENAVLSNNKTEKRKKMAMTLFCIKLKMASGLLSAFIIDKPEKNRNAMSRIKTRLFNWGSLMNDSIRKPRIINRKVKIIIPAVNAVNRDNKAGSIRELRLIKGIIVKQNTKKKKAIRCCFFWVEDTYAWFELFAFFIKTEISFPGMVNKPPGINKSKIVKIDE